MTRQERRNTQFLVDWIHEEMGALANPPVYRRMSSCKKMLEHWLEQDKERRARRT